MATCRLVSAHTDRMMLASAVADLESTLWQHPWGTQSLQSTLDQPGTLLLIAENAVGQLVSYCLIQQVLDEATVLQVGTAQFAQRQGLARTLLHQAIEHLRATDCQTLWLEVRAGNEAAIALYLQLGFVREAVRKRYYPPLVPGQQDEDAVVMRYSIGTAVT